MLQQIKSWLKTQLSSIDSIRSAVIDPAGHIVAHTWSSGVVHVHVLEDMPRIRQLKRIMQENTRVGIGSLFIISAKHVPEDGSTVAPDEALLGLHALYRDRLYTYGQRKNNPPHIGQVHFKTFMARGDTREVWYGPDVAIRNLPCYRVWVTNPGGLKGNWMVANFGSEAFWKEPDYTISREAMRREQQRPEGQTHFYTWSTPGWQPGGAQGYQTPADPPSYAPRETELDRCYKALGLQQGATSDQVKAAFRRLAREVHPDVSSLPKAEAEARFKKLLDSYNKIKAANNW